jgi:hypothetical protein
MSFNNVPPQNPFNPGDIAYYTIRGAEYCSHVLRKAGEFVQLAPPFAEGWGGLIHWTAFRAVTPESLSFDVIGTRTEPTKRYDTLMVRANGQEIGVLRVTGQQLADLIVKELEGSTGEVKFKRISEISGGR